MCVRIVPLATCRRRSSRVAVQLPLRSLRSLRSSCTATHRYRYPFPNPTFHNGWYRKLGHPKATLSRWRAQYGGMKSEEAKRLKSLEEENNRLKKIVADQALDIQMLKEIAKGN